MMAKIIAQSARRHRTFGQVLHNVCPKKKNHTRTRINLNKNFTSVPFSRFCTNISIQCKKTKFKISAKYSNIKNHCAHF